MHLPVRPSLLLVLSTLLATFPTAPGVPSGSPAATALTVPAGRAAPTLHVVRPGQTLTSIARLHGTGVAALAAANGLRVQDVVHPDGLLRLTPPPRPLPPFTASVAPVTAASLGRTWRPGCPVGPASLRAVTVRRYGFDGTAGTGTLVVHASLVPRTTAVFRSLYARRFPVRRMVPVSAYGGSDEASMAADNTSAFNCRLSTGSRTRFSEHSSGRAIDVNPVENPYVRGTTVLPAAGRAFLDRTRPAPGVLHADGGVAPFRAQGFSWGGTWRSSKDYQHFSTTGR